LIQRVSVIVLLLSLACAAVASSRPAHATEASAADLKKAEALATEGKVYFRSKLFSKSADKFMQAFGVSKRPALVYNAARAYEEAGKFEEAMAMFEHYQTIASGDAKGKAAAAERVASIRARVAKQAAIDAQKKAKAADKKRPKPPKSASDNSRVINKPGTGRSDVQGGDTASHSGKATAASTVYRGPRTFPLWRAIGSGAALMFAGASYIYAYRVATTILPADVISDTIRMEYKANQSTALAWQVVAIGSAAIGMGVGAWATWDWMNPKLSKRASWLVAPASNGRGVLVHGHF
jgi:tetratricopeptide (TPR) repeat protein